MKPLLIEQLMDKKADELAGGKKQRVALCVCLGKVNAFNLLDDKEKRVGRRFWLCQGENHMLKEPLTTFSFSCNCFF